MPDDESHKALEVGPDDPDLKILEAAGAKIDLEKCIYRKVLASHEKGGPAFELIERPRATFPQPPSSELLELFAPLYLDPTDENFATAVEKLEALQHPQGELIRLCSASETSKADRRRIKSIRKKHRDTLLQAYYAGRLHGWIERGYVKAEDIGFHRGLPVLRKLFLTDTDVVDIGPLVHCPHLEHLDLSYTQIEDISVLAGHPGLKNISLQRSKVSDHSPLLGLPRLRWIRFNGASEEVKEQFRQAYPNLNGL